nr:hypothetical protein [Marinicella sp. W31]MDC2879512.1 hypothetical protein [Marinicella sp. W31]
MAETPEASEKPAVAETAATETPEKPAEEQAATVEQADDKPVEANADAAPASAEKAEKADEAVAKEEEEPKPVLLWRPGGRSQNERSRPHQGRGQRTEGRGRGQQNRKGGDGERERSGKPGGKGGKDPRRERNEGEAKPREQRREREKPVDPDLAVRQACRAEGPDEAVSRWLKARHRQAVSASTNGCSSRGSSNRAHWRKSWCAMAR